MSISLFDLYANVVFEISNCANNTYIILNDLYKQLLIFSRLY